MAASINALVTLIGTTFLLFLFINVILSNLLSETLSSGIGNNVPKQYFFTCSNNS